MDKKSPETVFSISICRPKSLETELSIAICRQMTIENTVSSDFDPRTSIVKSVYDCRLFGVISLMRHSKTKGYLLCYIPRSKVIAPVVRGGGTFE